MAKTKQEKRSLKAERAREIRHWLVDEGVWMVAQELIYELFTQRKDVLTDYVRTEGHTDWVWLEEGLSAALSAMEIYGEGTKLEQDGMYVAAFMLAYNTIRTVHPLVRPPTWLLPDMALVAGVKTVPRDTAEVMRDMLLQGRDAEAMMLLPELQDGPFLLINQHFFTTFESGSPRTIVPKLSRGVTYVAGAVEIDGSPSPFPTLSMDNITNVDEAIGIAVRMHAEQPLATYAVSVLAADGPPASDIDMPWHDVIVFAIGSDSVRVRELEQFTLPRQ